MSRAKRPAAIVLAGGRSKRFRSATPKVLHEVAGRSVLGHVLEALRPLRPSEVVVVVPPGGVVEAAFAGRSYPFGLRFAVQRQPLGTGDATKVGLAALDGAEEVLVLAGDCAVVRPESLTELLRTRRRRKAAAAMLTAELDDPGAYGRVLRDGARVRAIVQAKDASAEELAVREIDAAVFAFSADALKAALPRLRRGNAAAEYYLTDAVSILVAEGRGVVAVRGEPTDVLGTNTRRDHALAAQIIRERVLDRLFEAGVTIVDPATTYVDAGVKVGPDTVLRPLTFLEGRTRIGAGCEIGPSVRLVDSIVEDGASVTFAVAVGAHIGPRAEVGPFASLRSGTRLGRGAKAGTFVETKAADIGEGSKVPHLSYMGDVAIGRDVNVGAGTITCNYNPFELAPDGSTKHRTVIGDDAYISSDTMLVAPVRIGRGAQTGAGAVVNADVPDRTLAFGVPARVRGPAKERARKGEPAKRAAKRSTASAGASKKKGTRASKKAPGRSKRKAR